MEGRTCLGCERSGVGPTARRRAVGGDRRRIVAEVFDRGNRSVGAA